MKRIIEAEGEEVDFLSAVAAAEESVAKRHKPNQNDVEGAYIAALRGSRSRLWQQITPLNTQNNATRQSRVAASTAGGSVVPEKSCPCGSGPCLVLTANTHRNRGRMFYKCPLTQENGGCGFFLWCDTSSQTNSMNMAMATKVLLCRTSQNHKIFLHAILAWWNLLSYQPISSSVKGGEILSGKRKQGGVMGSSCGLLKYCNDQNVSADLPVSASKAYSNLYDPSNNTNTLRTGSLCFKCGKDGHWAKDCHVPCSSDSPAEFGGKSIKSGTCYKCGKPGHWARDCTSNQHKNAGKSTR
ncbi:uncharacterized protein LOC111315200 [Durio zibethinus]|uniref:Uncharacterized protein LOC111315200 n=1 Tax=Durio zibethinus TaxID=66656 RepID=A0A6P6B5P5_DURZI|nr:uncharacterized protein LOC111315200 [Durio zibethinus]